MNTSTDLPPDARPHLAPRFLFRWEDSQNAWVLLYPEGIIKLNPSAAEILKRCDGERTPAQITADLTAAYPDGGTALEDNVRQFLTLALGKGWLKT